jgi:hypothetical protein
MTSNVEGVLRRMNSRRRAVEQRLGEAAREIAVEVGAESKRVMQTEVYNVPVPKRKSGKPAWTRTGNLKRRESSRADGAAVILENRAAYAVPRYTLGTPESERVNRPPVRSVQWQAEAIAKLRPRILERRRVAVLRALLRP